MTVNIRENIKKIRTVIQTLFLVTKLLKDTHIEMAPSNETPAFTKRTNMGIWVVGTSNQLFIRGS